ncbi:MAG: hypothetical protein Q4G34_05835, partial [Micrococcus sp.]|nr:hypothetical protein [Micrococcus sp.]
METRSSHPVHCTLRSLHADVDGVSAAALLDLARAYLGPVARGIAAPDSVDDRANADRHRRHGAGAGTDC